MGTKERFKRFLQGAAGVPALISSVESSIPAAMDVGDELETETISNTAKVNILGYRSYVALLTQGVDGAATVVAVLENTLGWVPTWEKNSTGRFRMTNFDANEFESEDLLTKLFVHCFSASGTNNGLAFPLVLWWGMSSATFIDIVICTDPADWPNTVGDALFASSNSGYIHFEMRIYD